MGKKDKVKRKITAALSIPKEIVLSVPLISMTGNEELFIENHKGVIEYSDIRIRINTSSGVLRIEGRALLLKHITDESISVCGSIGKLEFFV